MKPAHRRLLTFILFISGFCSLAYQVIWLREFKLLFGASTPAASAVLATFMGGLGAGGVYFGRRAERTKTPARLYTSIEFIIAVSTLFTPALLWLSQKLYIATGGSLALGPIGAPLVQILLTALVLGIPCFFMGGTLPAALRYAQSSEDTSRSTTAFFYGTNIIGALCGAFIATFFLLGTFGNGFSLVVACFANLIIATLALIVLAKHEQWEASSKKDKDGGGTSAPDGEAAGTAGSRAPASVLYAVAFLSGFVFFVIELVWYRASIPLLGGSVYNFGLILTIVLAGMGLGGFLYSIVTRLMQPSVVLLTTLSACLTLSLILPFAVGDWFAFYASVIQNTVIAFPFENKIVAWTLITTALLFPTALCAGMQFPAIVSLLGTGSDGISRQLGHTYGWNTGGSILGALLGGFILIPQISLMGTWRLAGFLSLGLVALTIWIPFTKKARPSLDPAVASPLRASGRLRGTGLAFALAALTLWLCLTSTGPKAYWQHSPIGFGRSPVRSQASKAYLIDRFRLEQRHVIAEADGRETSIAIKASNQAAVFSNGKSDGSAFGDAATTIMGGLIPMALYPGEPKRVCVVGLGTGTSSGWMAEADSIEVVDTIELEPSLGDLIGAFSAINHHATENPKVNIVAGDAREILLMAGEPYDVIFSEPSNPHRSGISNLYTVEYYEAIRGRLKDLGVFAQWLQAYEINNEAVNLVISTLKSAFPSVIIFQTQAGDLLFVCRKHREPFDFETLSERLKEKPFPAAMRNAWGGQSPEDFLARCIANDNLTDFLANSFPLVNRDGHNRLEFQLGKTVGQRVAIRPWEAITQLAHEHQMVTPSFQNGQPSPEGLRQAIASVLGRSGTREDLDAILDSSTTLSEADKTRARLLQTASVNPKAFLEAWDFQPSNAAERYLELYALATTGDSRFLEKVEGYRQEWPIDEASLSIAYYLNKDDPEPEAAFDSFMRFFDARRRHVWSQASSVSFPARYVDRVLREHKPLWQPEARTIFDLLIKPFPGRALDASRMRWATIVAEELGAPEKLVAIELWGPHYPFSQKFLTLRATTFEELGDPRLVEATAELEYYFRLSSASPPLEEEEIKTVPTPSNVSPN